MGPDWRDKILMERMIDTNDELMKEIQRLNAIIDKKRIDSQRLDWLEAHDKEALEVFYSLTSGFDLRQLIDRLMKEPLHD